MTAEQPGIGPSAMQDPTRTRPVLRRVTDGKVIGGVAAGLARYLDVDPVVVRIAFVLLALAGGPGVVLYLVGWIVIPEQAPGENTGAQASGWTGAMIVGGVLVAVGTLAFADALLPRLGAYLAPLLLMAVGVALLLGTRR